jgi:uncharacterized cupredoxin-like copper-binding protein
MAPLRRPTALAVLLTFGLLASGCGERRDGAPVIRVVERDFSIKAPHVVPAGPVRIAVENRGPVSHELLLIRATKRGLPLRADGFTVDEESIEAHLVAVLEPQGPGREEVLAVDLKPGRYILFCNMAGHYAVGMQTTFQVR